MNWSLLTALVLIKNGKAGVEGFEPPRYNDVITPGKQPGASASSATPQQ